MKNLNRMQLKEVVIANDETMEGINKLQRKMERTILNSNLYLADIGLSPDDDNWKDEKETIQLCKDLMVLNKAVGKITIDFCEKHDIDFVELLGAIKRLGK